MKQQIKEIQNYFKNRLFSGKFEIIKIETHILRLSIDGYEFVFWIGNPEYCHTTKNYSHYLSFMNLELTNVESAVFWSVLEPIVKEYHTKVLIAQKQEELQKLIDNVK